MVLTTQHGKSSARWLSWKIVEGSETAPAEGDAGYAKFVGQRDRALAIVVLSIDPSLLYLIGEPDDPGRVWTKLSEQFMKKSWGNKLELRRKLYSLRLTEGGSVQDHIWKMTELFNALAVVDTPLSEEDRVVYLLANLPDSFGVLVTALEASSEVPKMEVVTMRLLHEERKISGRDSVVPADKKAMTTKAKWSKKKLQCHYCRELGHFKRDCPKLAERSQAEKTSKHKSNSVTEAVADDSSGGDAMVVSHSVSVGASASWIVDSGQRVTCVRQGCYLLNSVVCRSLRR